MTTGGRRGGCWQPALRARAFVEDRVRPGRQAAHRLGTDPRRDSQHRTFQINTCGPIAELVAEAFNYWLAVVAFKIQDWVLKFAEVDYRDSKIVEDIRDTRLRNGAWTLNKYRQEIGEPPVDGGDDAVPVDRQNLVLWADGASEHPGEEQGHCPSQASQATSHRTARTTGVRTSRATTSRQAPSHPPSRARTVGVPRRGATTPASGTRSPGSPSPPKTT